MGSILQVYNAGKRKGITFGGTDHTTDEMEFIPWIRWQVNVRNLRDLPPEPDQRHLTLVALPPPPASLGATSPPECSTAKV